MTKKVSYILMFGTDAKGDGGTGTYFEGVIPNLQRRFETTESEWVKQRLHGYMSEQACATCNGMRLKKEALAVRLHTLTPLDVTPPQELHTPSAGEDGVVRVELLAGASAHASAELPMNHTGVDAVGTPPEEGDNLTPAANVKGKKGAKKGKKNGDADAPADSVPSPQSSVLKLPGYSIDDVTRLTVAKATRFFENLRLSEEGAAIAEPLVREIGNRLGFMFDVGLGYV